MCGRGGEGLWNGIVGGRWVGDGVQEGGRVTFVWGGRGCGGGGGECLYVSRE